jgi:hypothetical protein
MRISYKTHPALKFFLERDQSVLQIANTGIKVDIERLSLLFDRISIDLKFFNGKLNVISKEFLGAANKAAKSLGALVLDILESKESSLLAEDIYLINSNIIYIKVIKEEGKAAHMTSITTTKEGIVLSCFFSVGFDEPAISYFPEGLQMSNGPLENFTVFAFESLVFHLFKHYSEIEIKEVCRNKKEKVKGDDRPLFNELPVSILHLNSTWFTEIIRSEGFDVRGHMRRQPYKKETGEWHHKLIWINPFRKNGYHRRAQKVIEAEES